MQAGEIIYWHIGRHKGATSKILRVTPLQVTIKNISGSGIHNRNVWSVNRNYLEHCATVRGASNR
jgi:hypothetical protein